MRENVDVVNEGEDQGLGMALSLSRTAEPTLVKSLPLWWDTLSRGSSMGFRGQGGERSWEGLDCGEETGNTEDLPEPIEAPTVWLVLHFN